MEKTEFFYPSSDGSNKLHAVCWKPDGDCIAVLEIIHGMVEHIGRYERFAEYMTAHGIAVVGPDLPGHGGSIRSEDQMGVLGENGNKVVLEDLHVLQKKMQEEFPSVPFFFLGHSMGSFFVREYGALYGDELAGVIVMGTGSQPGIVLNVGKAICSVLGKIKGQNYASPLIEKLSIGGYNKAFSPARTAYDWLNSDQAEVDAYVNSPICGFHFPVNGYHEMFESIRGAQNRSLISKTPSSLPILFVSGKMDAVGGFGKGVEKAKKLYSDLGIRNLQVKYYPSFRHEILNEVGRETVYGDLLEWITSVIKGVRA